MTKLNENFRKTCRMLGFTQVPETPNGAIIKYQLYLDGEVIYSGKDRTAKVSGLTPFKVHKFVVAACTTAGCGKSSSLALKTSPDAPDGQPSPTFTELSLSDVEVQWDSPAEPNGEILDYTLYRRLANEDSGDHEAAKLATQVTKSYNDTDLKTSTGYEYRVCRCHRTRSIVH